MLWIAGIAVTVGTGQGSAMTAKDYADLNHSHLMCILYNVLLQMRTSEEPLYAQALSDVLHPLPVKMVEGESAAEIAVLMRDIAEARGVHGFFDEMIEFARKKQWKAATMSQD